VNSDLSLQLSISVVIVSQYDIYVKNAVLDGLSPPVLKFAIQSIFVEPLRKIHILQSNFPETQQISIGSQIDEREVKAHPKLHNLHIYYCNGGT